MSEDLGVTQEQTEETAHLREYIDVIRRHRITILGLAGFVFLGVAIVTFRSTPIYRSRALVRVEGIRLRPVTALESRFDVMNTVETEQYANAQAQLIMGRIIGARVVAKLGTPPFLGGRSSSLTGTIREVLSRLVGTPQTEMDDAERALRAYMKEVRVTRDMRTGLLSVSFDHPDRDFAAKVANSAVEIYVTYLKEERNRTSSQSLQQLQKWVEDLRADREETNRKLMKFRQDGRIIVEDEGTGKIGTMLSELRDALAGAEVARATLQARYEAVKPLLEGDGAKRALALPEVNGDPVVQQLRLDCITLARKLAVTQERLSPDHPDVKDLRKQLELANDELKANVQVASENLLAQLGSELDAALKKEALLRAELGTEEDRAAEISKKMAMLQVLMSDAKAIEDLYTVAIQRLRELEIGRDGQSGGDRVEVYEWAVPGEKVKPMVLFNLVLGVIGGLALGICVAFLTEYIDDSIKDQETLQRYIGIPLLGVVPFIGKKKQPSEEKALFVHNKPRSTTAECFRAIRTSVGLSAANGEIKTLMLASAMPGEGKSLIAVSLAITMAQQGHKVLLVDADMRTPRTTETLKVEHPVGLSSLLAGQYKIEDAVVPTMVPNLFVLGAGPHPPNPAELLGTGRADEVIKQLASMYDRVIIDTPAAMAVTDAVILAGKVDAVALVVRVGGTSRRVVRHCVQLLNQSRSRIVGAILNCTEESRSGYGYGYKYGYGYHGYGGYGKYGYGEPDEDEEEGQKPEGDGDGKD